jgi:hypothetical protein
VVEGTVTGTLVDGDVTVEGIDTDVDAPGALEVAATPLGELELTFP